MDKKILTIVLAIVLIGCFFLAYTKGIAEQSGFEIVKSEAWGWEKYVLILIPLSGVLLLVGALNNGNYPLGRNTLCWLPLLTVIFWIVGVPLIKGGDIGTGIKLIGIGLWITAGASLILALYNPRKA